MDEINGSVNVSEILATLDDAQKAAVMDRALVIVYKNPGNITESAINFINYYCRAMTPIQQSAVKALLDEVRKRREELLNKLMKAVEDAMLYGTGDEGMKIKETWKEDSHA